MRRPIKEPDLLSYQEERQSHWNLVSDRFSGQRRWAKYYHHRLEEIFKFLVLPGLRILELGCAEGDLLAALKPSFGVGVDFSRRMTWQARNRHPELSFVQGDAHALPIDTKFDVIILSDLLNDVWDVQVVLEQVREVVHEHTRVIITSYNRMWEPALSMADRLNLAKPNLYQNWLTIEDIQNLLCLSKFEPIRTWEEILWPFSTPIVTGICNKFLARIWPFNHLALTHFIIARPMPSPGTKEKSPSVSIVIPARNEAGNIPNIFRRMPTFGGGMELIFVEGHSSDATYEALQDEIAAQDAWSCKLLRQEGVGKGDAVRHGFAHAEGEILMILDADLTVPPEDLPRFYQVLTSGRAEFVNGVRLVYPMQDEAMRFFNLVGNKFFSLAFSWLLGQSIKDTLCGTKVLWRKDYEIIAENRNYFGGDDPFGDFDLLLGAAKQNLKIVDMPIRYRSRKYGSTNISRWKHGALLFRMLFLAARRLKFI